MAGIAAAKSDAMSFLRQRKHLMQEFLPRRFIIKCGMHGDAVNKVRHTDVLFSRLHVRSYFDNVFLLAARGHQAQAQEEGNSFVILFHMFIYWFECFFRNYNEE